MLILIAAILGLVVGSFLNVVIHRVPRGESVVRPPSRCRSCETPIAPKDNVPVLSWLILQGRCRHCGTRISARYPLVEAGTAVLFALVAWEIGAVAVLPAYLWFAGVTLALSAIDLDHHRLPNRILYPGTIVGIGLLVAGSVVDGSTDRLPAALAGGVGYFATLLVIALAARGGFGMGDVKLGFLLGVFLGFVGWEAVVAGGFIAFLVGGLVAIILLFAGRKGRKEAIPFGPFLVLGALAAIPWGAPLLDWYLR